MQTVSSQMARIIHTTSTHYRVWMPTPQITQSASIVSRNKSPIMLHSQKDSIQSVIASRILRMTHFTFPKWQMKLAHLISADERCRPSHPYQGVKRKKVDSSGKVKVMEVRQAFLKSRAMSRRMARWFLNQLLSDKGPIALLENETGLVHIHTSVMARLVTAKEVKTDAIPSHRSISKRWSASSRSKRKSLNSD